MVNVPRALDLTTFSQPAIIHYDAESMGVDATYGVCARPAGYTKELITPNELHHGHRMWS